MENLLTSKVGIILPTCNPYILFNKLIPTLENVAELAPMSIWLVNFNGDEWTLKTMVEAYKKFESYGFRIRAIQTTGWDKPINLVYMRELCARLYHDCDLYLFVDDDFKFVKSTPAFPYSSGERYLHSIDYMTRYPKCGVLNTKSFLGGAHQRLKIIPTRDDCYATNRGLFLRNMRKHEFLLYPEDILHLRGGLEETLGTFLRIELGYFCAKQMTNPTIHITGKLSDYNDQPLDFHNIDLIDKHIGAYLRDRYDNWPWMYEDRKFPKELWRRYRENGGLDIKHQDPNYTINYE